MLPFPRFSRTMRRLAWSTVAVLGAVACVEQNAPLAIVARIDLSPTSARVEVGRELSLLARALDDGGRELRSAVVNWQSRDAAVASVSTLGVVTGVRAGTVYIVATSGARRDSLLLLVTPAAVATIAVEPAALTLEESESRALRVTLRDASGRELAGTPAFATANATVATVGPDGAVTAHAPGSTTVSVTVGTRATTVPVTVTRVRAAAVAITPSGIVLEPGEQRRLSAEVRDARGRVLTDRMVTWSVEPSHATISEDGVIMGVRPGYVTIYATADGVRGGAAATVTSIGDYDYDLLYHRQGAGGALELFALTFGDGATPERLNAGTVARTPTAAPDGSRIAFGVTMVAPTGEVVDDIYAVDRVGTNLRRLTHAAGSDDHPAWSPAGGWIAYRHADDVSVGGSARSDIWVMRDDGTAAVNLTADLPATAVRRSPAWSADGRQVAFVQVDPAPSGTEVSIWIMQRDGSGKRRITVTTTGFDGAPTWSPDGGRLAFVRYFGGDADLMILTLATGAERRIALPGQQLAPAWSPAGDLIAFVDIAAGGARSQLMTMRPNGTLLQLRTLREEWGGGSAPTWIRRR